MTSKSTLSRWGAFVPLPHLAKTPIICTTITADAVLVLVIEANCQGTVLLLLLLLSS